MCAIRIGVRKIFEDRARLVIYMENSDLVRLTEYSRERGKTVVEVGRELILEGLVAEVQANSVGDGIPPVREDGGVRVDGGGPNPAVGGEGAPCDHDFGYGVGKCPYGTCRNRNKKAKVRCE